MHTTLHIDIAISNRLPNFQLGEDDWGEKYRENLDKFNVGTDYVETVCGKSTGIAQINVAESGENQIVIIPGANDLLSPVDIEKAQEALDSSKVRKNNNKSPLHNCILEISKFFFLNFVFVQILVCQLETPLPATLTALRRFKNGISILNASPAPNENTLELFTLPSILCINQVEAAAMSKRAVPNIE